MTTIEIDDEMDLTFFFKAIGKATEGRKEGVDIQGKHVALLLDIYLRAGGLNATIVRGVIELCEQAES